MVYIQLNQSSHIQGHNKVLTGYLYPSVVPCCHDNFLTEFSAFQHGRIIDLEKYLALLKYLPNEF